jgi:hypothetical protein
MTEGRRLDRPNGIASDSWPTPWLLWTLMANALTCGSATKLDFALVVMAASSRYPPALSRLDEAAQPTDASAARIIAAHAFDSFHRLIDVLSSRGIESTFRGLCHPQDIPRWKRDTRTTSAAI